MNKMWRNDGEEQQLLEKMFREKTVNGTMKPSDVQKKDPLFHGFTTHVFRKHWNATKLMFAPNIPGGRNNGADVEIIEIDGTTPTSSKVAKMSYGEKPITEAEVSFNQPPVVVTTFNDPETKQEFCFVIVPFLSRVKGVDFDVVIEDNRQVLKLTYNWPHYTYKAEDMFTKEGGKTTFVNKLHPKFLAVDKALESVRENVEDAPQGTIDVVLPSTIEMDPASWTYYNNKKADGTNLLFFEFKCVRSDYIIKKKEKSIVFE